MSSVQNHCHPAKKVTCLSLPGLFVVNLMMEVQSSKFKVQSSRFKVQGSRFKVNEVAPGGP
jgi:hypothetical protein